MAAAGFQSPENKRFPAKKEKRLPTTDYFSLIFFLKKLAPYHFRLYICTCN
jgi:hypothetical protein